MATPNQMPKKPLASSGWHRRNPLAPQLLSALIETRPTSWTRKVLTKDEEGKELVDSVKVARRELRFEFAQNMSEHNVELLAQRWL